MTKKLAILGGKPAFEQPLHVGRPNVVDREAFQRRADEMLNNRWFTNDGPFVREFEKAIADYIGVKHCVALCNATIALEIAIRALELRGEVIVPSFTFIATAHALQWQQITPVFADVDPYTHNLDPQRVRQAITDKTSGIIGVHLWGRACDTDAFADIAAEYKLNLIYDAAHAFGCSRGGKTIGQFGDCEVFSFHATKFLNSFEGGAIVTNDDKLAAKMQLMRNFGFAGYDNVVYIGTNGKLTEICAAMGLSSLEKIDDLIAVNERNHRAYFEGLRRIEGISLLRYDEHERNNFQYVVAEVGDDAALSRDELIAVLQAENILARKYFWPGCHRMEPYRSSGDIAARHLENTEKIAASVIVLPTGLNITLPDIHRICEIIVGALSDASAIRASLRHSIP